MAKKKYRKKSASGGVGKVKSLVKSAGMGLLGAMVVGAVAKKFAPQYADIASTAGSYLGGGVVGLAANLVISGVPSMSGAKSSAYRV